ncbi:VWA domain-containing protein [Streptomyces gamaensis]|uniref:VWA domain-containing protein n=1 Tax=Streptomyces gamaensis TaxID=1763542 RepID=A0ABW0Z3V5_9ACTN
MDRANGADIPEPPALNLELHQNHYLPSGDGPVLAHAALTLRAHGLGALPCRTPAAVVIVIDCSGSMYPKKITAARQAAAAAIGALHDGTRFALIQGTHEAEVVHPHDGRMAVAGPDARAEAARAAHRLVAAGGTVIGVWLERARALLAAQDSPIRHVLLLTDGQDEDWRPGGLEAVLAACAGEFTCDVLGVGEGWAATELRTIAARLHGVADAVEDVTELAEEFRTAMATAMDKVLADVRIRVALRVGSELRSFTQLFPVERDLTAEGTQISERVWEFPTGAWGDDDREYQLSVTAVPDGDPKGEDLQLAVVSVTVDGPCADRVALCGPVPLLAHWTADRALSTRVDPRLDHYGKHAELGRAVSAGCEAYERGDRRAAEEEWARALRLARELGDTKTRRRLGRLVTEDEGAPRIREDLSAGDLNSAWVSVDQNPRWTEGRAGQEAGGSDKKCPGCGWTCPASATHCTNCRRSFPDGSGTAG